LSTPLPSLPLRTPDGETLALREWPVAANGAPRAVVQMVHGIGEHSGRYAHVAARHGALRCTRTTTMATASRAARGAACRACCAWSTTWRW
jgi:hypothetical protein